MSEVDISLNTIPCFIYPPCVSLDAIEGYIADLSVSLPMATCESWSGLAATRAAWSHSQLLNQLLLLKQMLLNAQLV